MSNELPNSMRLLSQKVAGALPQYKGLETVFANTLSNTWATTLKPQKDKSVFVITGDIPAMWLRDSAAQVRPYLHLAKTDSVFSDLIVGVIQRQTRYVLIDPYANAFNEKANGHCHNRDKTAMGAWIWERKYELDSLCAPLKLAHDLWKVTGRTDQLDRQFVSAARIIIDTIRLEQTHEKSSYVFERPQGPASDTLTNEGRGEPVGFTGMSWCGFRPSDDACRYNYLVPSNMLAVVALQGLAELPLTDEKLKESAAKLAGEIKEGIETHARVTDPEFGEIYAYEVDGLGNHHLMDDANVPSLLALPYIGYCARDDQTYQNTRRFVLSKKNPHYYEGNAARGIGSPHTPENHIWPIALCMQGLTSNDNAEKHALLKTLLATDAGAGLMHESFHKDDPTIFTRPWFAWANSLFAEFVMDVADIKH
jgi:uncharacterized protein